MVRGIRGFPLLAGVRGEPPADLAVLEDVLLRLSQLVARHPRSASWTSIRSSPRRRAGVRSALDVRVRVG